MLQLKKKEDEKCKQWIMKMIKVGTKKKIYLKKRT